jgi:methionine sulfoxide reductase heme-binding subunit
VRNPLDYPWWLASRSAGIVAFGLLSLSVVLGLVMATKLAPVRSRAGLRVAHERIALLSLGAVAAHGLLLLGDPWLRPGVTGLIVPFSMRYRPLFTGIGLTAAYLAAGLSLSYYARRRIGTRRWRNAHRLIPIAWALAATHMLGAGSDAGAVWMEALFALALASIVVLLAYRIVAGRPKATAPAPRPVVATSPAVPAAGGTRAARRTTTLWSDADDGAWR